MQEETQNTATAQVNTTTAQEETKNTATVQVNTTTAQEGQEKTFTQAELDKIVGERLARERKSIPDDQTLKEFKEWKKSQQSEADRQAEREKEFTNLQTQAETLRRENLAIKAGVGADDVDYVLFKVGKLDGEFDKNLASFLTENKKYTEPKTAKAVGAGHSQSGQKSVGKEQFEKMSYQERLKLKSESPELYLELKGMK